MIAAIVEFIGARKWLIEAILLMIVAGLVWWLCEHLIAVGVQRQKDADAKATAQLVINNAKEEGRLQEIADKAKEAYESQSKDSIAYRSDHPIGTSQLCKRSSEDGLPKAARNNEGDGERSSSSELGERVPKADTGLTENRAALLDAFGALFDEQTSIIREWRSRSEVGSDRSP